MKLVMHSVCAFQQRIGKSFGIGLLLIVCSQLAGCNKGADLNISELEKAFPATAETSGGQPPDPVQIAAQDAVTALKKNNFVEGATALQVVRSSPRLNADQLTAVQDAMAALQMNLAKRADAGDPNAKRALEAIGQMRRSQ